MKKSEVKDAILEFLTEKTGPVKINDFLKSLYPSQPSNEQKEYLSQGANALLRDCIQELITEGKINSSGYGYLQLGQAYYPNSDQKTNNYNLDTVTLMVEKI